ncbi:MAG: isoprenylcysteine carboxylmethyltransferase family protein [Pirellulales bacterium]
MLTELFFRLTLLAVLLVTMSVAAYHRARAHSGEQFDRREEGLVLAVALRLAGAALWLLTLGYLIDPDWLTWAQLPLSARVRLLGVPVGIAGAGMMYWTLRALGKNLTDTVAPRADATLVTHGPYRYVRHPFYVTAALAMLSVTLLSANAAIGLCGIVVMTLLVLRTPREEARLLARFGEPYRAYRASTGAFFPRSGGPKG